MVKIFIASTIFCFSTALCAKSADQCEAEIGPRSPDVRQKLVAECLLKAMNDADPGEDVPRHPKIIIEEFGIDEVNSAGGVEPYAIFVNPNKSSSIKYVTITLTLFNAVGDRIGSELGHGPTRAMRFTGPLTYERGTSRVVWGPVWYNSTGACVTIQSLSVEYMNGKKFAYAGRELNNVLSPTIKNSCKPS